MDVNTICSSRVNCILVTGWYNIVLFHVHMCMQVLDKGAARGATPEAQSALHRTRRRQRRVFDFFVSARLCRDFRLGRLLRPEWGPDRIRVSPAGGWPKRCRGNDEPLPGESPFIAYPQAGRVSEIPQSATHQRRNVLLFVSNGDRLLAS